MNDIGIVILNYNTYDLTKECVNNLLSFNLNYNIVIVDNNSNNNSYSILSDYFKNNKHVDVIQSGANKGYAYGNNCGCHYLLNNKNNINYLCIMNPDVIIEYKEIFNNLKKHLIKDDTIAAITGLMHIRGKLKINNCYWSIPKGIEIATRSSIFAELDDNCLNGNDVQYVETIPGSFFIIRSDIYNKLNGFDEGTFLYNEETILAIMIKNLGMHNAISTKDYYNHNHIKQKKSLLKVIRQRIISDKSDIYLCKKYFNSKHIILLYFICACNYFIIPIRYFYRKMKNILKA